MKRSILITTLAILAFPLFTASAQNYDRHDYRDRRDYRRSSEYRHLRAEIDQLNRMFAHISANLYYYRAGRQVRRDYSRLLRARDRLNYDLQNNYRNLPRIRAQVDRIRDQLREIEVRLRVRQYYRWH